MKVELDFMEKSREKMVNAAEGEQFKRKENDPSLKPNNLDTMVSRGIYTSGNNWLENIPQQFTDHGGDRGMISIAGSETPCNSLYSVNDAGVMVEELTLKKYKSSQLSVVGSSHGMEGTQNRARSSSNVMEGTQIRPRSWQYLYQLSGGSRNGRAGGVSMTKDKEPVLLNGVEDVGNGFGVQTPQFPTQSNQGQAEISGHSINKEKNMALNSQLSLGGALKKVLPSSSFCQISNGKEKELPSRYLEAYDSGYAVAIEDQEKEHGACVVEKSSDVSLNLRTKTSDPALKSSNASLKSSAAHGMVHDEISLRDWLKHRKCKSNKSESLNIFKQIVELVDLAHTQQIPLDVRPSCFMISPSYQVKYAGSVARRDWLDSIVNQGKPSLENHSSRKRYLEGAHYNNSAISKNQKGSKSMKLSQPYPPLPVGYVFKSETDREVDISSGTQEYRFHTSEQIKTKPTIRTLDKSGSISVPYAARQQLASPNFQLEEKWYASPEELNDSRLTLLSNIYSLGVLLFELLCWFESSEVHTAAMLDLRYRILPPNFLSESPKEAGSCLWLLHPEPSSRPTTRVILHSELIFEFEDLSSKYHSPSSSDEDDVESDLLLHFLATLKEEKVKQASKIVEEIGCLEADFKEVEKRHLLREILSETHKKSKAGEDLYQKESLGSEALSMLSPSSSMKEGRLMSNINQLENAYFSMKSQIELSETDSSTRVDKDLLNKAQNENDEPLPKQKTINDRLGSFFDGLCKYARYDKFDLRATLRSSDLLNSSNVICSLGFDRDEEHFAAAGVSKKIKIFEFNALLDDSIDIHYPVVEMPSKSKLSCVCWNNYIKNYLASTDYDGVVQLWDVNTGQGIFQYREHEKRAWSVDFSKVDPTKLASGSDDCAVKLWTINEQKCISTIKSVANVCCVQFSAHSTHLLAFGSADYKTYCYDLRYTRIPWCILSGHSRAVSYVKFLNPDTIVSASTDNTLKLWDLNKTSSDGDSTSACSLSFRGHTNEKNFVGLSVSDGYIACGSETNEVYSYYKSLPMPITSHKFGSTDPITGQETGSDVGQFVASVCWRGKSNMLVAANSIGSIKVLEMV